MGGADISSSMATVRNNIRSAKAHWPSQSKSKSDKSASLIDACQQLLAQMDFIQSKRLNGNL